MLIIKKKHVKCTKSLSVFVLFRTLEGRQHACAWCLKRLLFILKADMNWEIAVCYVWELQYEFMISSVLLIASHPDIRLGTLFLLHLCILVQVFHLQKQDT